MLSFHLRWREDQYEFIRRLPGNQSENIRRAIDQYIQNIKATNSNSSMSSSKRKGDS